MAVLKLPLLALLLLPLWAHAAPPWTEQGEAQALAATLSEGARYQRYWRTTWASLYATSAVANSVRAERTSNRDSRYDGRVTAVKSILGFADVLLSPPSHHRRWQQLDMGTTGEIDLHAARDTLAALEIEEQQRHGWQARVSPLLVNAAAGLLIGVEDNRPRDGWINAATGMLVTELRIRTEPRHATRHTLRLGEYAFSYSAHWWLLPDQIGVQLYF